MIDPTDLFQEQWENMDPTTHHINKLQAKVNIAKKLVAVVESAGYIDPDVYELIEQFHKLEESP